MDRIVQILTFVLFFHQTVNGEDTCSKIGSHLNTETCTKVVDFTFCEANMPPQDIAAKPDLKEIHTYAELKRDPRSSIPEAFTICSTIMRRTCRSINNPVFFNILDNNFQQLMAPWLPTSSSVSGIDSSNSNRISKQMDQKLYGCQHQSWITRLGHRRYRRIGLEI